MKKEYFNIPNLMGYFRILLIPVFLILYGRAETSMDTMLALLVLAVSYLTDFLDGKIARKFNMVTDWGKMLDPVADKLAQGALALALTFRYPLMIWFLLLFLGKEIYMGAMGLYLIRKGKKINGATRYGKICTGIVDGVVFVLLLFPGITIFVANILMMTAMAAMVVTWAKYIVFHTAVRNDTEVKKRKKGGIIVLAVLLLVVYIVAGALVPYTKQPKISHEYAESFDPGRFYSEDSSGDRAVVLEENGAALTERIRLIENARERIVMSTFDFRADSAGRQILAALRVAAERGVHIQILMDGFNSWIQMEGNPWFYALSSMENVEIKIYNKVNPLEPWKAMSRMHDKYLIADDNVYILGGRNTFDYFLGDQSTYRNYDRDVLVYHAGDGNGSVRQILDYFEKIWNLDYCTRWHDGEWHGRLPSVVRTERELADIYADMKKENPSWFQTIDYEKKTLPTKQITLLSNPTSLYSKEPQVFYGLQRLMQEADQEVIIHTPYVICNDMMYQSFKELCDGDAPVTLMTNSADNNGNPFGGTDYALNKEKILDTGLHVLEYEGGISYHGKSITIDDDIAIVGSFNMDMKSVYQDTELMLVINSKEVNAQLKENLEVYQQDADEAVLNPEEIDQLTGNDVPLIQRIQRSLIRLLDPYVRFLM